MKDLSSQQLSHNLRNAHRSLIERPAVETLASVKKILHSLVFASFFFLCSSCSEKTSEKYIVPTDDELIETFTQNPNCFSEFEKISLHNDKFRIILKSNVKIIPNTDDLDVQLIEQCLNRIEAAYLLSTPRRPDRPDTSINVSDFGFIGSGQSKGFYHSPYSNLEPLFDTLDKFTPQGEEARNVVEDQNLFRQIAPNWYLYYNISY